MKHRKTIATFALTGLLLGLAARAAAYDNEPYRGIAARNIFDLKPPIASRVIQPSPPTIFRPKPTLTGITTILGKKIVFLTVPGATPGSPPEFLILAEGQIRSDIEVKQIDENAWVVKVINHGEAQSLDFRHDGVKPFPPAHPTLTLGRCGYEPEDVKPSTPTHRTPTPPIPALQSAAPPLTSEEQIALIELQRAKMLQEGDPTAQILPPTPLTPDFMDITSP